jgi:RHS repeat-associated protein
LVDIGCIKESTENPPEDRYFALQFFGNNDAYGEPRLINLRIKVNPPIYGNDPEDGDYENVDTHDLSSDHNYLMKTTPTKGNGSINELGAENKRITIEYFDGFGRHVQSIEKGITPNKNNLISGQVFDAYGRIEERYLPIDMVCNGGKFILHPTTNDNTIRYAYDDSPLNRIHRESGPGYDWQINLKDKISDNIINNNTHICKKYVCDINNRDVISIACSGNYKNGELFVVIKVDEDENTTYEFKDKLGQVVLIRQMEGETAFDTYYIYDIYGNLKVVLPPIASDRLTSGVWKEGNSDIQQFAYLYKYDEYNRCIAKKIPGTEWVYYIYDKADRLIFRQDGELRKKNEWLFNISDALGREVLTGICKNNLDYTSNPLKNTIVKAMRTKTITTCKGYDVTFNLINPLIYSVNYYDNYDYMENNGIPDASDPDFMADAIPNYGKYDILNSNKGLLTGTSVALLDGSGTYINTVIYYDDRERIIQSKSTNHMNGIDKEYFAYNFTGQPILKMHIHSAFGKTTQTEVYTYTYDHAGRLLNTTHQLNGGTVVTLAENTYDELGRLKTNKKGGNSNLQSTYAYNIRSWTKSITSPLFTETLYYNESYGGSVKQYNGNISAMSWKHNAETNPRGYAFVYDNLSRLTKANYLVNGAVQTYNASTPTNPIYQTAYSYDKHGNIKTLQRYGLTAASTYGIIDNLTAGHTGNQLKYITDAGPNVAMNGSMDFKDYTKGTGVEYTYNANGAMVKDLNKGISQIVYNNLNLPRMVDIKNKTTEGRNEYTYSADGRKLKAVQKWNPNYSTTPVIGSTINTAALTQSQTTDYIGNKVYENNTLKRILVDGGYYEGGIYYFYITDHLGNNRVVANASGTVVQKNHYYPFGMAFAENAGTSTQPYKYNGKELDGRNGLNWYDYSARYLSLDFPGFGTVDPLAEKYYSWSPYVYVKNNSMRLIDPTGMYSTEEWKRDNGVTNDDLTTVYTASTEEYGGPVGPPASYWMGDLSPQQQQKVGETALRYFTPLEDIYGLIAGENFDGEEYNRGKAGFWAAVSFIPIGKIGKIGKPIIGLSRDAAKFAAMSKRADHAMRHLITDGILKGAANSRTVRSQWVDLVIDVTGNPTKTFDYVLEGTSTKAFYKVIDGKDVIMFVAKENRGSVQAGQVIGSWVPSTLRNPDLMKLIQP